MILNFLINTLVVIGFMYITLKILSIFKKFNLLITSLLSGTMSIFVMLIPFRYDEMFFDLRSVPIIYATYRWGWKVGVIAAILPMGYRLYIGGLSPLIQTIGFTVNYFIPIILCAYFYKKERDQEVNFFLRYKSLIKVTVISSVMKFFAGGLVLGIPFVIWAEINTILMIFSIFSLILFIYMTNDYTKSYHLQERLIHFSTYDSLTNLLNIRSFKDKANEIMKENDRSFYILMVDIDHFKKYNDKHGHPAGDKILLEISKIFRNSVRNIDLIGRYGGEEFIILLRNMDSANTMSIIERIRMNVENHSFYGQETHPNGKVTVSIGGSYFNGENSLQEIIEKADKALYESKMSGRNKVTIFKD